MRDGEFNSVEDSVRGRIKLNRQDFLFRMLMFGVFSFGTLMLLGYDEKVDILDIILPAYLTSKDVLSTFNVEVYYYIFGPIFMVVIGTLAAPSYRGTYRKFTARAHAQKKSLSIMQRTILKIFHVLDRTFYYMLFPLSVLILRADASSQNEKERVYLRWGWLDHLESSFFKQEVVKSDGYSRANELKLLDKYYEFFTKERGEEAKMSEQYMFAANLFASHSELHDLMLICEGFVTEKKLTKYDTNLNEKEFRQLLSEKFANNLESFRVYDGKSNIYFSQVLFKEILDKLSSDYELFLKKHALMSRTKLSRQFNYYYTAFYSSKTLIKEVFSCDEIPKTEEELRKKTFFVLSTYFRITLWHYLINMYCNVPPGTVVVKMRDYSIRMVIESFDSESLIMISEGKNDGTNSEFSSDIFVNLFLISYNYFMISTKNKPLKMLDGIFNLHDGALEEFGMKSILEAEKSLHIDMQEGLSNFGDDELKWWSQQIKSA